MEDRSKLLTEQRLAASMNLDQMSIEQGIALMNEQDAVAVAAVAAERANVGKAVELAVAALKSNGRLFYVGAGSSGRLGVLDASECPPTFSTDPRIVQGIIAGGNDAMFKSIEGAEDDPKKGAAAMDENQINELDVVMGIAAGGTTPFVRGALQQATQRGAATIFLCCIRRDAGEPAADVVIRPLTGAEVLTGSTRLKAGTATKLVLNQMTTMAMVQMGKVYENLMVDLKASNQKLRDRAVRIVSAITGLNREDSRQLLERAQGEVKTAVVMHKRGIDIDQARQELVTHHGSMREAM